MWVVESCFYVIIDVVDFFSLSLHCNSDLFSFLIVTVAIWGGSVSCVSSLHRGEYAAVADETREAQDL